MIASELVMITTKNKSAFIGHTRTKSRTAYLLWGAGCRWGVVAAGGRVGVDTTGAGGLGFGVPAAMAFVVVVVVVVVEPACIPDTVSTTRIRMHAFGP